MDFQEIVAYIAVAVAVVAVVWAFSSSFGDYRDAVGSLREKGWEMLPRVFKMMWGFALAFEDSLGAMFVAWMPQKARRLEAASMASALPLKSSRVLCACAGMGMIFGILGIVAAMSAAFAMPRTVAWTSLFVFLFMFWIGWLWPQQSLKAYAIRRQRELARQLPFAIDLIGSAMRSGLDFGASLRYYVGLGVEGPLQYEFTRVLTDTSAGRPFVEALQDMDTRIQIDSFSSFVGAIAYGADVGAPLSDTLRVHADELRRSRFALAEQKAAKAPILMLLPLAVCIMPSVFIVILTPIVMQLMKMRN